MADSEKTAPALRWPRILAVLVVVLALTEGFARAYIWLWAGQSYHSMALYRWSPYGLVRNNPDLTSPHFQINANGFRNLETFQRQKAPDTYRVLLLGGSVLYAGLANIYLREEGRVDSAATVAQFLQRALAQDPALRGMRVEVINAAVNFNRIVETSTAYLAEYAFWDPDLVVVFGSANNFLEIPTAKELAARAHNIQGDHPWRAEFERVVNRKDLASLAENALRTASDSLASVAIFHKLATKALDVTVAATHRFALVREEDGPAQPISLRDEEAYFRDYAAFADAMVAAARRHDQDIAFFWEYRLAELQNEKPMGPREKWLVETSPRSPEQTAYAGRMHDRWVEHLRAARVPFIDPLDELRRESGTVYIDYLHYTRSGNEFMANIVYDRVRPLVLKRLEWAKR